MIARFRPPAWMGKCTGHSRFLTANGRNNADKRWIKKMGKKKATIALANLLLRICYNLLKEHKMYIEYGSSYLDELNKKKEENMIRILKSKGYSIERAVV
jgi:hypothetical protein